MSYMIRARIRVAESGAAVSALRDVYSAHQAVWDLFADHADRKRDFLYRLDLDPLRLYAVADRPPIEHPFWETETKEYAPAIEKGDLLQFSLRANATKRSGGDGGRSDGRRHDVVMDAKRKAREAGETIDLRELTQRAGMEWLEKQGRARGFTPLADGVRVTGHRIHEFRKPRGGMPLRVSGLDFDGMLRVDDANAFAAALRDGIGPAKGFGFGLMLVRRA